MRFLLSIDRRIIFLLVLVAVIVGTIKGEVLRLPIVPSNPVRGIYDAVDTLPARAPVLISLDFDPASAPELGPMSRAMLRHALGKGLRVSTMTHWPSGVALAEQIVRETAAEFDDVTLEVVPAPSEAAAKLALDALKVAQAPAGRDAILRLAAFGDPAEAERLFRAVKEAASADVEEGAAGPTPIEKAVGAVVEAAGRIPAEKTMATRSVNFAREKPPAGPRNKSRDLVWHLGVGEVAAEPVPIVDAAGKVTGYEIVRVAARKPTLEYGKDWCFLGYKAGAAVLIIAMGQNLHAAFPTDKYGTASRNLAVLEGVRSLADFKYMISLAAGNSGEQWIAYGATRYGFPMGIGCTAVIAPDLYPYWQSKQITGVAGGIKGAWEYEALVGVPADAQERAPVQTVAHLLVIALILFCNAAFLVQRLTSRESR